MPHYAFAPEYVYPSARDRYLHALAQEQAAANRHRQPRCQTNDRRERGEQGYWDSLRQRQAEQIQRQREAMNRARRPRDESSEPVRIPISTPKAPSNEAASDAASTIQSQWRAYKDRKAAFSTISSLASNLATLKSSFTFPAHLEFAPNATESSPILAYNQHNMPVLEYEHQLTKLLTLLDAVDSKGLESVRNARKALVREVEAELERVDVQRIEAWRRQVAVEELETFSAAIDVDEHVAESAESPTSVATAEVSASPSPADNDVSIADEATTSTVAHEVDVPTADDATIDDGDDDFRMQEFAASVILPESSAPSDQSLPTQDEPDSPSTTPQRSVDHVGFLESMEPVPMRFPSPTLPVPVDNDAEDMVVVEKMVDEPADEFVMV